MGCRWCAPDRHDDLPLPHVIRVEAALKEVQQQQHTQANDIRALGLVQQMYQFVEAQHQQLRAPPSPMYSPFNKRVTPPSQGCQPKRFAELQRVQLPTLATLASITTTPSPTSTSV